MLTDEAKPIRRPLPKTRKWRLTERLRNTLVGKLCADSAARQHHFVVWIAHSKFIWWKFYRDDR